MLVALGFQQPSKLRLLAFGARHTGVPTSTPRPKDDDVRRRLPG